MKNISTKIIYSLIHHSEDWFIGELRAEHVSGVKLWIKEGANSLYVMEPVEYRFGFFARHDIWSAIRYCKINILNEALKYDEDE